MKSLISLFLVYSFIGLGQVVSKNTIILSGYCGYGISQLRDTISGNRAVAIQKTKNARLGLRLTYMVKERMGLSIGYVNVSTIQEAKLETVDKQKSLFLGTLHLFKILPKIQLGVSPRARYTWLRQSTKSESPLDQGTTTRIVAVDLNLSVYWFFHRRWALSLEQGMGTVSYSYSIVDQPADLARNRSFSSELLPSFQLGQLSFGLSYLINNKGGKAEQAPVQP